MPATGGVELSRATQAKAHRLLARALAEDLGRLDPPDRQTPLAARMRRVLSVLTPELHVSAYQTLDARAWALSGANLPSQLGLYCEAMTANDVPEAALSEFLLQAAPVVKALCERQDAIDRDEGEEEEEEEASALEEGGQGGAASPFPGPPLPLPAPEAAQRTRPVRLPKFFTEDEVERIKALSGELAAREHRRPQASSQWRTRYLHAGGAFRKGAPDLLARIREAMLAADARPGGWGALRPEDAHKLLPRTVEHHIVAPGGALPDPTHFDGGSLFTLDVMLAEPGADFEGGEFCTLESDGSMAQHDFGKGDVLVFLSHKAHCVRPVTRGLRQTLIVELWEGEERRCDHRCCQPWGARDVIMIC